MAIRARDRPPEVAEGVYRLGTRWINFYLVAEDAQYTLVDSGYPRYWKYLSAAIDSLGSDRLPGHEPRGDPGGDRHPPPRRSRRHR
jgi:hypothetical protein